MFNNNNVILITRYYQIHLHDAWIELHYDDQSESNKSSQSSRLSASSVESEDASEEGHMMMTLYLWSLVCTLF